MAPLNETSDQPGSAQRGPVFVDASGWRFRRLKLVGLAALGLVAGYVLLLLIAFMGGPNVAAPYLPLPAAAKPPGSPSSQATPASHAAGTPTTDGQLPAPLASAVPGSPAAWPSPVPVGQAPQGAPTQQAANFAAVANPAPGTAVTAPGKSGTAPGQVKRPSAPAHP